MLLFNYFNSPKFESDNPKYYVSTIVLPSTTSQYIQIYQMKKHRQVKLDFIIKTLISQIQMQRKNSSVIIQELQKKLEKSQRDKVELKKSIEQLNECYQIKINMLQNTIEAYENRIEQLLEWKKSEIEKQLTCSSKYEQQNKKLLDLIQQLQKAFGEQRQKLNQQIANKNEIITQQKQSNEQLISKGLESEQKIDQLVREHTRQIQELKKQLMMLKEEIIEGSLQEQKGNIFGKQSYETSALKQITNEKQNTGRPTGDQTRIKQLTYRSPSNYCIKNQ